MRLLRPAISCCLVCLAAPLFAADRPATTPAADSTARPPVPLDAQDLIFLGPSRPVLLRLRVTVDGLPFRQVWRDYFSPWFSDLDRDHDGLLSAAEAAQAPPLTADSSDPADGSAAEPGVALRQLALQHADKLDRDTFLAYWETAAPPFSLRAIDGPPSANKALFAMLDRDRDGRLSIDELRAAADVLRSRDFDDDEVLTQQELAEADSADGTADVERPRPAPNPTPQGPFVVIGPATRAAEVAAILLRRYDKNADALLSARASAGNEIRLADEVLARLDTGGDATLDPTELSRFHERPADLELRFPLGRVMLDDDRPDAALAPAGVRVKRLSGGTFLIHLSDAEIELRRNNRNPARASDPLMQLAALDADGNAYLDEKEAAGLGRGIFKLMDRDADGRVFKDEYHAYYRRRLQAAAARVVLEFTDDRGSLFDLLDANHDFLLTPRELRSVAATLASENILADGMLSSDALPQRVRGELSRGGADLSRAVAARVRPGQPRPRADSSAPLWFRKMDRNHDGDVSPREFLGPRDAFEKIDANRDGLIDAAEAEAISNK